MGLEIEPLPAVRARRMRVEKGGDLLLEEVALEGAQELFGLGQTQPEMLDALVVLVEGDDIGDGFFMAAIPVKRDKLPSIAYSEELIFSMSATLQRTDRRHGIVGQERCYFQCDS